MSTRDGNRLNARKRDVLSGVVLAVLAVAYFFASGPLPAGVDEPGPRFFPRLLALALLGLGVAIAFGGAQSRARDEEATPSAGWRPDVLAAATLVFVALVPPFGLLASTFLYALTLGLLFHGRVLPSVATAALSTAAVYGIFVHLLGVSLP